MEKLSKEKFVAAHFILSDECNLRCPYCFVDHKKNIMSREVAKKGVDFLFNGAIESGSNSIVITFFGGEPTLNIDHKILNKATGDKIFEATTMQIAVDISSRESFYTAPHQIVNALREANGEKD